MKRFAGVFPVGRPRWAILEGRRSWLAGHRGRAFGLWRRALATGRALSELGARYEAADSLVSLGDTYAAAAVLDSARDAWQQALDVLTELGHPDAESVRERLRSTAADQPPSGR